MSINYYLVYTIENPAGEEQLHCKIDGCQFDSDCKTGDEFPRSMTTKQLPRRDENEKGLNEICFWGDSSYPAIFHWCWGGFIVNPLTIMYLNPLSHSGFLGLQKAVVQLLQAEGFQVNEDCCHGDDYKWILECPLVARLPNDDVSRANERGAVFAFNREEEAYRAHTSIMNNNQLT
ncbi:hypothetical protein WN943_020548 [Citrus x changshan-huyou]